MRLLLILMIGLFSQTVSFAQVDAEEMQKQMEQLQKEMQEQLKNFNFEDFKMDTLMLKNFTFPEGFNTDNFIMPNDVDMNELLKMMERQMSQMDMEGMMKMMEENMSKMDLAEMEKMMEPFMKGDFFMFPMPEDSKKEEGTSDKATTPKKKKLKTYCDAIRRRWTSHGLCCMAAMPTNLKLRPYLIL